MGHCAQHLAITHNGGNLKRNTHTHTRMHTRITVLYAWDRPSAVYQLCSNKASFKVKEVSPLYFLGAANLCHELNALQHQVSCRFWVDVIRTPPSSPILKFRARLTNGSAPVEEPDSLCKRSSSLPFFTPDRRDLPVHPLTCHLSVNAGILCRF